MKDFDPLVMEDFAEQKELPQASPLRDILGKENEDKVA